jgi:DNA-binding CsgD family transcriptional regulator
VGGQSLLVLAQACALGADPEGARAALAEFDALDLPPIWHWIGLHHTRAWVAVACGDLPGALRLLDRECALASANGDLLRLGAALHTAVRLGRYEHAADRLGALAREVEGDLPVLRAEHAAALGRRDAARLDEVSEEFERIGADLLAAEAAADAATAWRRAGAPRPATAAQHRAVGLLTRCEGARTPATQSIVARAVLTPAERETAVLAAAGRSNKEIAEAQQIAVRTVETRLQSVYSKLGIGRRGDLSDRLQRL